MCFDTSQSIRRRFEKRSKAGGFSRKGVPNTAKLPLSEECKKILAYASHEAESMLYDEVSSEHCSWASFVLTAAPPCGFSARGLDVLSVREAIQPLKRKKKLERFSGTSKNDDFQEALRLAIAAAKDGLRTDFVQWTLIRVFDEDGGVVLQNDLTVEIEADGPST